MEQKEKEKEKDKKDKDKDKDKEKEKKMKHEALMKKLLSDRPKDIIGEYNRDHFGNNTATSRSLQGSHLHMLSHDRFSNQASVLTSEECISPLSTATAAHMISLVPRASRHGKTSSISRSFSGSHSNMKQHNANHLPTLSTFGIGANPHSTPPICSEKTVLDE
ncbi:hypothetical protein RFI_24297, partial [Reticulomyxa filosa]